MPLPKKQQKLLLSFLLFFILFFYNIPSLVPYLPKDLQQLLPSLTSTLILPTQYIPFSPTGQTVKVIKIIDGDTIQIEGGRKLRYIGMDTPETVDPRKKVQCFGNEASLRNKDLVLGKQVFLERDISETDKFGRLLRYVYVANQENQQIMINEQLVREGYAYASSYPPDIKYQEKLQAAEREARENKRGLWSTCTIKN